MKVLQRVLRTEGFIKPFKKQLFIHEMGINSGIHQVYENLAYELHMTFETQIIYR